MDINLSDKVAMLTGVGRGIGREVVTRLAREGVSTVALDVSPEDLSSLQVELSEIGGIHTQHEVDIRDGKRVREIVQETDEKFGRVDILVNNAGVSGNGLISELPEDVWDFCHDVNLKGTFLACQAVIPIMKRQQSGRIINSASFAAMVPAIGSVAYASSKAAVVQFTRGLAGELGPWNITVNSFAPGMIPTSLNNFANLPEEEKTRLLDTLSLRRWGQKNDIANLICFLSSDLASYITGSLIDISGGKLATQNPSMAYEFAKKEGL